MCGAADGKYFIKTPRYVEANRSCSGFCCSFRVFDRRAKLSSSSVELGMDLALFGYEARPEAGENWAHTLTYRAVA